MEVEKNRSLEDEIRGTRLSKGAMFHFQDCWKTSKTWDSPVTSNFVNCHPAGEDEPAPSGRQNQEILLYYYQMFMVHVILSMDEMLHQLVGSLSQVVQDFFHQQYYQFFMVQHDIQSSNSPIALPFLHQKNRMSKKKQNLPCDLEDSGTLLYAPPKNHSLEIRIYNRYWEVDTVKMVMQRCSLKPFSHCWPVHLHPWVVLHAACLEFLDHLHALHLHVLHRVPTGARMMENHSEEKMTQKINPFIYMRNGRVVV